jgi:cysteine desulfurase
MKHMGERIYLDWNASAPLRPRARAAMLETIEVLGNPSSIHAEGRAARHQVEQARERVDALVGAEPRNVIFTSGGSEANALALCGSVEQNGRRCDRLLVSAIEHPSVLCGGRFAPDRVERLPVTGQGVVDLESLPERLSALPAGSLPLVSIMHANNETGAIQPIAAAAEIIHAAGGLLHVDAAQSVGRIPCNINELHADLLSISAHKLGGPKGAGAVVKAHETVHIADPLIRGGGQERGSRAGTETVAAISGFGAAATDLDRPAEAARMMALRQMLEAGLSTNPATTIFAVEVERLPNTALIALAGLKADTAVIALDLAGIAVSAGAACSSGKVTQSSVLTAMGVAPALAGGAIRVSFGATTAESEIGCFLEAWRNLASRLSSKADCGLAA